MRRRPSVRARGLLTPDLWACCVVVASAGLMSCGGRAADGLGPEWSEPSESEPADDPPEMIIGPRRETCADNPLLAECPRAYDACTDNPLSAGCVSAQDDITPPLKPLKISIAENVLASLCAGCHGPALTESQASYAINYISDWDRLIEAGLIRRCAPERSRIIRLMREGDMPPSESGLPPVTEADIELVADAINFGCGGE